MWAISALIVAWFFCLAILKCTTIAGDTVAVLSQLSLTNTGRNTRTTEGGERGVHWNCSTQGNLRFKMTIFYPSMSWAQCFNELAGVSPNNPHDHICRTGRTIQRPIIKYRPVGAYPAAGIGSLPLRSPSSGKRSNRNIKFSFGTGDSRSKRRQPSNIFKGYFISSRYGLFHSSKVFESVHSGMIDFASRQFSGL